jgi:hypothetical protein
MIEWMSIMIDRVTPYIHRNDNYFHQNYNLV